MKKLLGICDRDKRYGQMMQNYLLKRLTDFEVLVFGSLEQAVEYSAKHKLSICLVSEHFYDERIQELQAVHICILRESGEKEVPDYPYIEKYQSMERLIRDMLEGYSEECKSNVFTGRRKGRVHAFYSPVRRFEQTKAALALGQVLAGTDKKVLYLNMQPFSERLGQHTSTSADITDLLYFMGRRDNSFVSRLQNMKQTMGGVDFFDAAADYMDVLTISEEQWILLLTMLTEAGEYEEILLDLSEICRGLYPILEKSDCVYSIQGETPAEQNAVNRYKELLEKREKVSVLEKTNWLALPQELSGRAMNPERLGGTGLGEYMKGMIRGNDNGQI